MQFRLGLWVCLLLILFLDVFEFEWCLRDSVIRMREVTHHDVGRGGAVDQGHRVFSVEEQLLLQQVLVIWNIFGELLVLLLLSEVLDLRLLGLCGLIKIFDVGVSSGYHSGSAVHILTYLGCHLVEGVQPSENILVLRGLGCLIRVLPVPEKMIVSLIGGLRATALLQLQNELVVEIIRSLRLWVPDYFALLSLISLHLVLSLRLTLPCAFQKWSVRKPPFIESSDATKRDAHELGRLRLRLWIFRWRFFRQLQVLLYDFELAWILLWNLKDRLTRSFNS